VAALPRCRFHVAREQCASHDIFLSVKDVLDRLLAGETNYDDLRPDVWKQSHPEAIRIYRVEERQARADAKTVKWARRREASRLPIKS